MDTKQFKKILRESIESDTFLGIEEVRFGRLRIPADQVPKNSMRYALAKYLKYKKEEFLKGIDNPEDVKFKAKHIKQAKKDFIKVMKDLRLFTENDEKVGIDASVWAKIYPAYHKESKLFKYKGEEIRGSDAIWNVFKERIDKAEKSKMTPEEYGKFFDKERLRDISDKLDNSKEELEKAFEELNYKNFITVIKNMVFAQFINEPEDIENVMESFPLFVKSSIEDNLNKQNPDFGKFYSGLVDYLKKSPLFSQGSAQIISQLYNNSMYHTLELFDKYLEKDVDGGNKSYIEQFIAGSEKRKASFNEGIRDQYRESIQEYLNSFLPFAKNRLGYDEDPKINFVSDPENGKMTLGKTAFYEPAKKAVTVFTDNRHPKDIMRSLSHELVHHAQNCDGQFDLNHGVGEGYAQNDEHLRKMEEDAYLRGNMCFRDWEDGYKQNNPTLEKRERVYYELMRRLK